MKTSINITNFSWPEASRISDELAAIVDVADQGGIDTVFVSDHLIQAHPASTRTTPCSRPIPPWVSSPPAPDRSASAPWSPPSHSGRPRC